MSQYLWHCILICYVFDYQYGATILLIAVFSILNIEYCIWWTRNRHLSSDLTFIISYGLAELHKTTRLFDTFQGLKYIKFRPSDVSQVGSQLSSTRVINEGSCPRVGSTVSYALLSGTFPDILWKSSVSLVYPRDSANGVVKSGEKICVTPSIRHWSLISSTECVKTAGFCQ